MDATKIKRKNEGKRIKRENEGINRRKESLIKKVHELGQFEGVDVVLIIRYGRYIMYLSKDYRIWLLSMAEIVNTRLMEYE